VAVKVIEGRLVVPSNARIAIVASRFNHFIVDRLVDGAIDAVTRHAEAAPDIHLVRVPGAWEIPSAVARLAKGMAAGSGAAPRGPRAIIALGAVIRGSTPHFDYVAAEVTKGIAAVSRHPGRPVPMGILTTDTIEQAIERAGTKAGNKGWEAAVSAIEMMSLDDALTSAGL